MPANVLLIGGSGFVGHHLVSCLKAAGCRVTLLNRGTRSVAGVAQLIADRTDAAQVRAVAADQPGFDVVIDTSAYREAEAITALDAFAQRCGHWIHLSSTSVYQDAPVRPWVETDPIGGAAVWGDYGRDKSDIERRLVARSAALPVTILRPPYLYGPANDNDRETFVWSRVLRSEPVLVPGEGTTPIQFLHAADLATAVLACLEQPPARLAIYNVAGDEIVTLADWVSLVASTAGRSSPVHLVRERNLGLVPRQYFPFRDFPCVVNVGHIKSALDWRPAFSLRAGLHQTFASWSAEELMRRSKQSDSEHALLAAMLA